MAEHCCYMHAMVILLDTKALLGPQYKSLSKAHCLPAAAVVIVFVAVLSSR